VNTALTTAIVLACLLAAVWAGARLRRIIPPDRLCPDTRDTIKLATGLVATMTALLLGLLISSTKATYDTNRAQVLQVASKFALLDRMLEIYGPRAAEVRGKLHAMIEESTRKMWPDETKIPSQAAGDPHTGNAFYVALLKMEAGNDAERTLKAQGVSLIIEIGEVRSLMYSESATSISQPLLLVVVLWLVIIFAGFSLLAPPNTTAKFALLASALCAAGAIFLMLELDRPFDGLMRISSEPMLKVLSGIAERRP
jgi:hypothetical protein